MSFRENVQHLRAAHRMTQEQLAMLLGVSRQSVTKWESGKSNPEMDKLLKICEIFGCTLDDLVCGDLTSRPAEPTVAMPDAAPADVCGYDEERRSFARSVSTAVACFILGPACSALLESLGRLADIDHRLVDVLGVLPVLGLVAAGVALVVPAGIRHSAFVRSHPFVEDFYTEEDRAACRTLLTRRLVAGIALILLGVAVCVVVDQYLCLEDLAGGLMLCLVAVGVRFIVLGGMLWGGMDVGGLQQRQRRRRGGWRPRPPQPPRPRHGRPLRRGHARGHPRRPRHAVRAGLPDAALLAGVAHRRHHLRRGELPDLGLRGRRVSLSHRSRKDGRPATDPRAGGGAPLSAALPPSPSPPR